MLLCFAKSAPTANRFIPHLKEWDESVLIGKPRLDLMILPSGEILEFESSSEGIRQFVKHVKKFKPTLIACEYTGGLEQPLLTGRVADDCRTPLFLLALLENN